MKYFYELSDRGNVFDDMLSIIPSRSIFPDCHFELFVNLGENYSRQLILSTINNSGAMKEFSEKLYNNRGESFLHKNFTINFFVKGDSKSFFSYRSF